MTERMISGADEPRAMRVRLATVAFQNLTVAFSPLGLVISMVLEVTCSMAPMKMSAMMPTPMKHQMSPEKYAKTIRPRGCLYSWWSSPPRGRKSPDPPLAQICGEGPSSSPSSSSPDAATRAYERPTASASARCVMHAISSQRRAGCAPRKLLSAVRNLLTW